MQSFNVERPKDLPLHVLTNRKHTVDALEKYANPYDLSVSSLPNNFPVLKIEEDFDDITMTNGTHKSISTQTGSPITEFNANRINKKAGSSNSLWTSDESILRGAEEDTKSSSSCEETGGVMSSGKSGEKFRRKKHINCGKKK